MNISHFHFILFNLKIFGESKKFYVKLKQNVPKICTLCTVGYIHKTHSQLVKKMQGNIRIMNRTN